MRFIIKVFFTACAVMLAAYLLDPHVTLVNFWTGVIVALVLAVLNAIVRPILLFISIPATILTLGLFIFVINAVIILLADKLIDDFVTENFWWALLFSIIVSFVSSILNSFINKSKQEQ
ncbi:MAG: phage holin family protein [Bacteroidales bacterium]|jgi:putative membrane protein|nr:phage holin family protein [Bacteroidales bacterium]MDD4213356.1 phage holin family protein [Bacteroidales bacterium]